MIIQGHSGFTVALITDNNKSFIRKSTTINPERLKKQCYKQKEFFDKNRLDFIKVPYVIEQQEKEGYFHFDMEYFNVMMYIDFMQETDVSKLRDNIFKLLKMITTFINDSEYKEIKKQKIIDKYRDIRQNILNKVDSSYDFFVELDSIFYSIDDVYYLPVGVCHGDMTFSNLLFSREDENIILIDFLDSFIETPLVDMVKLRQDTKFLWSVNFYKNEFDLLRLKIVMKYIDQLITKYFSRYEFYRKYYKIFELLNLLRVLQYAKDEQIKLNLKEHINNEKLNYSSSR